MGVFEFHRIKPYVDDRYHTVVETGTCLGYSTVNLARAFRLVHTIELNESLYMNACRNFAPYPHVVCHHGDSKEVLKKLIPTLSGQVIFFLDAHWSGDSSVDWKNSLWKGYGVETSYCGSAPSPENQVPLLEEIKVINATYLEECIIYIDDADKFDTTGEGMVNKGFAGEDWSHLSLERIREVIKDRAIKFDLVENQLLIKLKGVGSSGAAPREVVAAPKAPEGPKGPPLNGPKGIHYSFLP